MKTIRSAGLKKGYTNIHELVIVNPGKVSWERFHDEGTYQKIEMERHLEAGWLQIRVREQGSKSAREAYFTFDATQVEALRTLLAAK